jgi:hypothetical protein
VTFAFFGLPAYGEDSETTGQMDAMPSSLFDPAQYRCGNDMICSWAGSLACADGISVIAGTGSMAYGEFDGRRERSGGWGELIGDEGSAYWIAREGMNLFSRMSDGRAPRGALHELVRDRFGLDVDLDLCARIYGVGANSRRAFAQFAPLVHEAALAGDAQSRAIIRRAADELVAAAQSAAHSPYRLRRDTRVVVRRGVQRVGTAHGDFATLRDAAVRCRYQHPRFADDWRVVTGHLAVRRRGPTRHSRRSRSKCHSEAAAVSDQAFRMLTRVTAVLGGLLAALTWPALAGGAEAPSERYRDDDYARVEKIDAHVHLHGELPVFMRRAIADRFRLLTINVNYADFPQLDVQLRDAVALQRAYPANVAFAATFDASDSAAPGWSERTLRALDAALAQGAVAVKVWKDIGMQWRDRDGRVVMIDDERFTPVFRALSERGVVVLGHQASPQRMAAGDR